MWVTHQSRGHCSLNTFFVLLHLIFKQTFRTFHYHLTNPSEDPFIKFPCTKEEILEILPKIDSNKETGKNSIPLNLIK